jgi:hypothetical protein
MRLYLGSDVEGLNKRGTTMASAQANVDERHRDITSTVPVLFRPDHLFFAPNSARKNTAVNADPTIATDLTTTSVRAVSAGEAMPSILCG